MSYSQGVRIEYWKATEQVLNNIPTKGPIIWAADNNGHIARPPSSLKEETKNAHIGRWHIATESEKENVEQLVKTIRKFVMTATNTINTPTEKRRPWKSRYSGKRRRANS